MPAARVKERPAVRSRRELLRLRLALTDITVKILKCEAMVKNPENRERLIQAELQVCLASLSECPESAPRNPGHHGG